MILNFKGVVQCRYMSLDEVIKAKGLTSARKNIAKIASIHGTKPATARTAWELFRQPTAGVRKSFLVTVVGRCLELINTFAPNPADAASRSGVPLRFDSESAAPVSVRI